MNEGNYYGYLKGIFLDLCQRQWAILPDGAIATISWIGDAKIPKNDSNVYIRFNSNLQPYLYELQTKYTTYELQNVLVLKGKYAIRLYEILRSQTSAERLGHFLSTEAEYSIEQLRELLMVDGYKRWSDFESKVISPAIKEINTYNNQVSKPLETWRGEVSNALLNQRDCGKMRKDNTKYSKVAREEQRVSKPTHPQKRKVCKLR